MSLLVRGGTLLTRAGGRAVPGDLRVEAGRIREVGDVEEEADRVLDAEGCLVVPGLVDAFAQLHHLLLGPPRDLPGEAQAAVEEALRDRMTKRDLGMAAVVGMAERLRRGVTCLLDPSPWADEAARAATQVGLKACLAWEVREAGDLKGGRAFLRSLRSREGVTPWLGVADFADPELLAEVAAVADEEGSSWTAPVAATRAQVHRFRRATGRRPVEWLRAEGLLSRRLVAVHGAWLTREEVRALAGPPTGVVHTPTYALAGAGGLAPVPELLAEGVPVALGSGSPFRGGRWDPFHLLRLVALLHRRDRWDPTVLPAPTLLDLATRHGAELLGTEAGVLEAGRPADVAVLAPPAPTGAGEAAAFLVHEADGSWVRHVLVAGRPVVEDGRVKSLEVERFREAVTETRRELGFASAGD